MDKQEKIAALKLAGFTIRYADVREAYAWSAPHVNWSDAREYAYTDDCREYVELGSIAASEDQYDQVPTWRRSNYRRLMADYGNRFAPLSYSNVDVLGAFVSNLDEDLVNTLVGLAVDYPLYDDEDESALKDEEITEAWSVYLYWDATRDLPEDLQERASEIGEERLGELFYAACYAADYYPEHDGLDVQWDDEKVREILIGILGTADVTA